MAATQRPISGTFSKVPGGYEQKIGDNKAARPPAPQGQKGGFPMVAYYENEAAVDAALKAAKTSEEVLKIVHDLEQRMAPHHWTQKAWDRYRSMI